MQEWKFSEKEAQKMTHDGAISVNLVTGEATHISDRPPEQDYSPDHEAAGTVGRAMDEAAGHVERRQAKKARRKRRDTFREGEAARNRPSSRLQFSEADRAAPELKKPIRKSDKAVDKLDAAKAAVPVKPPGKEHGNPLSRPVQEIRSTLHGEVSKVEGENSGVQAGHLGERQIEKAVGYGGRRFHQARADRKLKPWRDVTKAEQAAAKVNADFYWQKSVMENPQLASSNPISRLWQKKRLQKQYAAAHRAGTGATQAAGKASQTAASAAKKGGGTVAQKLGGFVTKNKHTLLIVGGIGLMLMLIMGLMQSCTSMFGGGTSGLVASSYLSEDADLTGAEAAYCGMEAELQEYPYLPSEIEKFKDATGYEEFLDVDPAVIREAIQNPDKSHVDEMLAFAEQAGREYEAELSGQAPAPSPDDLETGETVRTPRGTFYVTDMSREQMEAAGYGLHHQSDDGKYLIMGNGSRAFAIRGEEAQEHAAPEKMTVLVVEPMKEPYVKEIAPGLHSLQAEVGGDIATAYPFSDPVGLVCNDEGKLIGLELNRGLRDEHGEIYDVMAGTFLVVGLGEESFTSLTPEQVQKYMEHFKQPEQFISLNGQIIALPVEPENPLRTAEMTLEDDYGMIDGVLNNGRKGEELEKAQGEARRTTPEKKPSIRERLAEAKRECGERKPPDKVQQKKPPEHDL